MEPRHRILVVEDDPDLCALLTHLLADAGYSAEAVHNGTGLRSFAYGEADALNPPCAMIVRSEVDPRLTFSERPLVVKPRATSPSCASARACRSKSTS